jgi:hypothetical protein
MIEFRSPKAKWGIYQTNGTRIPNFKDGSPGLSS